MIAIGLGFALCSGAIHDAPTSDEENQIQPEDPSTTVLERPPLTPFGYFIPLPLEPDIPPLLVPAPTTPGPILTTPGPIPAPFQAPQTVPPYSHDGPAHDKRRSIT